MDNDAEICGVIFWMKFPYIIVCVCVAHVDSMQEYLLLFLLASAESASNVRSLKSLSRASAVPMLLVQQPEKHVNSFGQRHFLISLQPKDFGSGSDARRHIMGVEDDGLVTNSNTSSLDDVCLPCLPGTFGSPKTNGGFVCVACGEGTFQPSSASDACLHCPTGHESVPNRTACVKCGVGMYSAVSSAGVCMPCMAGYFVASEGSAQCMQCSRSVPIVSVPEN